MKTLIFFLVSLSFSLFAFSQNEITLYIAPSPLGMEWKSPFALLQSVLKNRLSFRSHFMGHVFVEIKCQNKHELTGMVGKNFDYLNQLLVEQKGLGILFHSFEGKLEDKAKIEVELSEYFKTGYVNFTRFLINDGQCKRALKYLSEYKKHSVGRFYGLANRPRHGEGADSAAFAVSFLDLLDILDTDMQESWSQTVNIPLDLSGLPIKEQKVSLIKLIFNASSWASEKDDYRKLTFWVPDRMYRWVDKKINTAQSSESVLEIQKARGIVLDKSHFPAPEGPIWLQVLSASNTQK